VGGCYSIDGVVPVVHPTAFLHPDASLIGDVHIGARCYIGPGASLRGDLGRILVEEGSNVQDNCVVHCYPGRETRLAPGSHVGHSAVLHGCAVGAGALIGIAAVLLDDVVVGERAFVGAHSFLKTGFEVPPGWLAAGSPARLVRELGEEELAWKANGTVVYQELTARARATLRAVDPLPEPEAGRPRLGVDAERARPLREHRTTAPAAGPVAS
jgi:phenylacetic acid degradation protein